MLLKPFTQEVTTMNARPRKEIDTSTYVGRFAARLKMLREKAGLSVDELAERSGIPAQTLYRWEQGNKAPSIERFPELAESLNLTVSGMMPKK